ncbi:MAG: hypothetical protein ACT4QD_11810 [Acidobacteriota bacterium]
MCVATQGLSAQQPPATPAATFTRPATSAAEVELALDALPETLRADATVDVLRAKGYERVREGKGGLSCLLSRSRPDTQEPICWDKEGSETIMPVAMDEAAWRRAGVSEDEIAQRVAAGFSSGKYRAPRRAGVSYMMSTENWVHNGERVIRYRPHVMIYAPYVTNKDIGADGKDPGAPWVLNEGSPHAYIIVATDRW